MNRRTLLRAALPILAGALSPALTLAAGPETDIRAVYARAARLFQMKDTAGIKKLLTADCVFVTQDGQSQSVQQWEQQIKTVFEMIVGAVDYTVEIQSLKVKGGTATVVSRQKVALKIKDPEGKVHDHRADETSIDELVRTAQGWKMKRSVTKSSKQTIDGKPLPAAG